MSVCISATFHKSQLRVGQELMPSIWLLPASERERKIGRREARERSETHKQKKINGVERGKMMGLA